MPNDFEDGTRGETPDPVKGFVRSHSVQDLRGIWEDANKRKKSKKSTASLPGVLESDEQEFSPAREEAGRAIPHGIVRQQSAELAKTSQQVYLDDVLIIPPATLMQQNGYLPKYILDVQEELKLLGIINTSRAKVYKELNTLHIDADFKSTGVGDKSAKVGEAASGKVISGHILEKDYFAAIDRERDVKYSDLPREVYPLPAYMRDSNGNPQFVTHERQTLSTIEARIASGYYTCISTSVEDGIFVRIIADQTGQQYRIEYDPNLFANMTYRTGSPLTVRDRKMLIEAQGHARMDLNAQKATDPRFDKTKIRSEVHVVKTKSGEIDNKNSTIIEYDSYVGLDKLIKDNSDVSVPLFRTVAKNSDMSGTPFILCNAKGKSIKGDVDLQDLLLPNDLPLMAYKYIYTGVNAREGDLVAQDINGLKDIMKRFRRKLEEMRATDSQLNRYAKISEYVSRAIENIERIQKEKLQVHAAVNLDVGLKHPDEILLKEIGTLTLLNAVLIFAQQDGRLHGADAGSPVRPENIAVTHIPNPNSLRGDFIATHGEYEYLKALFNVPGLNSNHIKDFNLCHLVADQKWRSDLSDKVCPLNGVQYNYANKSDEMYIVKLHRLLLEKQLLECRLEYTPERYNAYVKMLRRNFEIMIENIKYKGADKEGLQKEMIKGFAVAEGIIAAVAACEDPRQRLEEIASITQHSADAVIKANLDRVMFLDGTNSSRKRSASDADISSSDPKRVKIEPQNRKRPASDPFHDDKRRRT